jgi:hypothetical protein
VLYLSDLLVRKFSGHGEGGYSARAGAKSTASFSSHFDSVSRTQSELRLHGNCCAGSEPEFPPLGDRGQTKNAFRRGEYFTEA